MAKGLTSDGTDRLYQQPMRRIVTPLPELMERLRAHHPLVIEGMSGYDPRAPEPVANHIVDRTHRALARQPVSQTDCFDHPG